MRLLLFLVPFVLASDSDIFPKQASELVPGDWVLLGSEPANVTDVGLNDDGTLNIIAKGLFTQEFLEREMDPNDVVDVSSVQISEQKVQKMDENDFVVLEDGDGTVTDDAEILPELRDKLASALKLKQEVKREMEQWLLQLLLAIAMFVATAVAGFIPVEITKCLAKKGEDANGKGAKWLSLLSCFSGGVFMATCFLDIIPHINETYESYKEDVTERKGKVDFLLEFPVSQLLICFGFFFVYLVEEICVRVLSKGHSHSHNLELPKPIDNDFVRRGSVNLRNEEPLLAEQEPTEKLARALSVHSMVMEETANYAVAAKSESTLLKSLTFAVAMSFHSVLEGFALGVQSNIRSIITLFVSLLLHKGIEAFSVGLQVSRGNSDKLKAVATTILIYAMMTPLGSGLGTLLRMSQIDPMVKDGFVLLLESMAAGTFIYVTFLEVLAHEKDNEHNSLVQLLAIFVGFAVIALLQLTFGEHGHEEHEHHHHAVEEILTTLMTPTSTQ